MIFTKNATTEEPIGLKNSPLSSDLYIVQTKSPSKVQVPPPPMGMNIMNEANEEQK